MLRFHMHRLILAALVLAPVLGAGLLLGTPVAGTDRTLTALQTGLEQVAAQATETATAPRQDARSAGNELRWPFFSFGRRGAQ